MRRILIAMAFIALAPAGLAQPPKLTPQPPLQKPQQKPANEGGAKVPLTQPAAPQLPTPQGELGDGLYTAGRDRGELSATGETLVASLPVQRGSYQVIARAVIANDR